MTDQIRYEVCLAVLGFITGCWMMVVYDALRIFRLMIAHNAFFTGLEDFFYWIYGGALCFMLLFEQNQGRFRAYIIAGVFAGMALYDRLISRFLFRCLKKLENWIRINVTVKRTKKLVMADGRKTGDKAQRK